MTQLPLPLRLADHAVFASFLPAGNEPLVAALETIADGNGDGAWIWGPAASGKSHLLQAVCERAGEQAAYLPLAALSEHGPAMLDGLARRRIVCLDDLDTVLGQEAWELALFALCNQLADSTGQLLVAAAMAPRAGPILLPDLRSRLARLPAFQLRPLAELDRLRALQLRASHRGLELPAEAARYMLTRNRRDMASLYELLDRLDREALQAQRRLTVPFVREVLKRG